MLSGTSYSWFLSCSQSLDINRIETRTNITTSGKHLLSRMVYSKCKTTDLPLERLSVWMGGRDDDESGRNTGHSCFCCRDSEDGG